MGVLGHGTGRTHSPWRIRTLRTPKFLPEFHPFLVMPEGKSIEKTNLTGWLGILFLQGLGIVPNLCRHSFVVLRGMCHHLSKAEGHWDCCLFPSAQACVLWRVRMGPTSRMVWLLRQPGLSWFGEDGRVYSGHLGSFFGSSWGKGVPWWGESPTHLWCHSLGRRWPPHAWW